MILDRVDEPKDLRVLRYEDLDILAKEIRGLIIDKVNTIGGHCSPNLGIVEATIAMHYVFNSPVDKFIFDVSHQCYTHKILTGRKDGYTNSDNYLKYTGYTAPQESSHDLFTIGHTSTSVSLATGVAKARDLKNEKYNVIALIGDGSLTGGEAMEGLNNASMLDSNLIIIVNDNEMSIAPNYGGLYKNLKLLRDTNGQAELNMFKTMGFDYRYLGEGNNIEKLIALFKEVKDIDHPIVLHLSTEKGHGFKPATDNKEMFHWICPNILDENYNIAPVKNDDCETYTSITKDYILGKTQNDSNVIVVNAATPGVFGFDAKFRENLGKQYTDVGIAEEHAVAYSSALAKMGAKPILTFVSSFVQRTYDQLSQDLCLNKSPLTMLIYWGGISSADCTHLCTFDIPLIANIPNMVYLAPTTKEEYMAMLNWSVEQTKCPVAIRVPNVPLVSTGIKDDTNYSELNKFKVVSKGEKVAILGLGNFFGLAEKVKKEIKNRFGFDSTLINPKFITGLDEDLLNELKNSHNIVITLEDGILDGGFGEKIARYYGDSDVKVLNYGGKKEFIDRVPMDELYERYRLKENLICDDIAKFV